MTAMSRLATEHKADRATKDNPHRKRKSAEAFPSNTGVAIAKLNPNSKTLPPLSMGQQNKSASAGPSSQQQPTFQGSLVSAAQAHSSMHRQHSGSQPTLEQAQNGKDARKRVKVEQRAAANSGPQAGLQASFSRQTSGSKQTTASKQRSGSRQSSDDAQTHTEVGSQHLTSRQSSPQLRNADTVASAAAHQPPASIAGSSVLQHANQAPLEQQVSFPFRLVMPKTTQSAPGVSSSALNGQQAATRLPAAQPGASQTVTMQASSSQQAAAQPATSLPVAFQSVTKREETVPAASGDGENCMAALAEAAAAASEGSAASSSSHAHSDDDEDAAAILRDLHNSAGPAPAQASPPEGMFCPFSNMCVQCLGAFACNDVMPHNGPANCLLVTQAILITMTGELVVLLHWSVLCDRLCSRNQCW